MVKALIFSGSGVGQHCLPQTEQALLKYNIQTHINNNKTTHNNTQPHRQNHIQIQHPN
jgi:hypothetical protein